uniref:sialomucin core protein 24-like n=1 Tax=Scatophagus argus TaxID=75038 RepID=UPI001ED81AEC|nr:sialomucin core protein 24-like [Scatophagus argus]
MDTIFSTQASYLLALSFVMAQTENGNLTMAPTTANSDLPFLGNLTHMTAMPNISNFTAQGTTTSNLTENETPFPSMTWDNETFTKTTAATTESTINLQTSQSTTIVTPLTNSTPLTTTTHNTPTTTPAMPTTAGYTSTPDTTVTTANSSHTVNTTSDSVDETTQADLPLDISEKSMTILFSVVLGVLATALVVFMFHKCKQKIQYLHQPLNNSDDTDAFATDDDTLVISGGLYDGHPIYDNVPTVPADQSQFRLEFLH